MAVLPPSPSHKYPPTFQLNPKTEEIDAEFLDALHHVDLTDARTFQQFQNQLHEMKEDSMEKLLFMQHLRTSQLVANNYELESACSELEEQLSLVKDEKQKLQQETEQLRKDCESFNEAFQNLSLHTTSHQNLTLNTTSYQNTTAPLHSDILKSPSNAERSGEQPPLDEENISSNELSVNTRGSVVETVSETELHLNQPTDQTTNKTTNQTTNQTSDQTSERTSDRTSDRTATQTVNQTVNQTSNQTTNRTTSRTENTTTLTPHLILTNLEIAASLHPTSPPNSSLTNTATTHLSALTPTTLEIQETLPHHTEEGMEGRREPEHELLRRVDSVRSTLVRISIQNPTIVDWSDTLASIDEMKSTISNLLQCLDDECKRSQKSENIAQEMQNLVLHYQSQVYEAEQKQSDLITERQVCQQKIENLEHEIGNLGFHLLYGEAQSARRQERLHNSNTSSSEPEDLPALEFETEPSRRFALEKETRILRTRVLELEDMNMKFSERIQKLSNDVKKYKTMARKAHKETKNFKSKQKLQQTENIGSLNAKVESLEYALMYGDTEKDSIIEELQKRIVDAENCHLNDVEVYRRRVRKLQVDCEKLTSQLASIESNSVETWLFDQESSEDEDCIELIQTTEIFCE